MAVPFKHHEKWRLLITGQLKHEFKSVPGGMMLSRLTRDYQRDPAQAATLIDRMHEFFVKYESMLGDDITKIFGR